MASHSFRILINSIGTAQPATSAAIASGLGLPAATVIARLYSAPAVLIDGIDEAIARAMVKLLSSIGYEAEVQETTQPVPKKSALHDVSIYIKDARRFQHVLQTVIKFTGISEQDATRMILSPPGIILGSVSKATVTALAERLGADVSVLFSPSETALYSLFLSEDEGNIVHRRITQSLKSTGIKLHANTGLVASDIDHATARELWQRYQSSALLRIVNQDFLRFDLVLQPLLSISAEIGEGKPVLTAAQLDVLEQLAGIPPEMAEKVIQAAPITVMESVPNNELAAQMTVFSEAGLNVRANLITFQMLALKIQSLVDETTTAQALDGFNLRPPGNALPPTPFVISGVMPELKARMILAALEDTGAQVTLLEVA